MADALLADLDDLSDVDPDEDLSAENRAREDEDGFIGDGSHEDNFFMHDVANANDTAAPTSTTTTTSTSTSIAPTKQRLALLNDPTLQQHLSSVRSIKSSSDDGDKKLSAITDMPMTQDDDELQHSLIIASNKHLISLGHEIHRTHLELCRLYHPKFPELEELLTDPFQYRAAIGIIQNEMDVTKSNDELNEILSSNQIITISVAGSTTSGRPLSDEELTLVNASCQYLDELRSTQQELTTFVESKMELWAPNVCALIGPAIAAQLLASTGGLSELSKIPACNLQLLGKNKSTSLSRGGMATQARVQHAGYLMECDMVESMPNYLKLKAAKAVAGKLALAARADHVNVECGRRRSSEVGDKFREELRTKFGKWEEPDKAQVVKALPK
jgi:U4/U6 small nuclear ribonucleoprotein PRP31